MVEPSLCEYSFGGAVDSVCFRVLYDVNARNNYPPPVGGISILPTTTGDMSWIKGNGDEVKLVSTVAGDVTFTLPASSTATLVDSTSSQTMQNKTLLLSDGNVVEASSMFGAPIDGTSTLTESNMFPRYNQVANKWQVAKGVSGSGALSLDTSTNIMSVATGFAPNTVCSGVDARLQHTNMLFVKKEGGSGVFTSVAAALAEIVSRGDAAEDNRYLVQIDPGNYSEPQLNVPDHVAIRGTSIYNTIIEADDPNHHVIKCSYGTEINNLQIQGATGVGKAGIYVDGLDYAGLPTTDNWFQTHKVEIADCYYCVYQNVIGRIEGYLEYTEFWGPYYEAVHVEGTHWENPEHTIPTLSYLSLENVYCYATNDNIRVSDIHATGIGAFIRMISCGVVGITRADGTNNIPCIHLDTYGKLQAQTIYLTCYGVNVGGHGGIGILMENQVQFVGMAVLTYNLDYGLVIPNTGGASFFDADIITASARIECIRVDHPNAYGNIKGNAVMSKVFINTSNIKMAVNVFDMGSQQPQFTAGSILIGSNAQTTKLDLAPYVMIQDVGLVSGGVLTVVSGMQIQASAGSGYLTVSQNTFIKRVSFATQTLTLPTNNTIYEIYINSDGVIQYTIGMTRDLDHCENLILGMAATGNGEVLHIQSNTGEDKNTHRATYLDENIQLCVGVAVISGLSSGIGSDIVTVGGGEYMYGSQLFTPSTFTIPSQAYKQIYRDTDGTTWIYEDSTSTITSAYYNPSSTWGKVALVTGEYARHILYIAGDSAGRQEYFVVLGKTKTTNSADLDNIIDYDLPQFLTSCCCRICDILVHCGGTPTIPKLYDTRPYFMQSKSSSAAITGTNNHSQLVNLGSDDHTQYIRTDGTRTMTGALNMGTYNITNAGTFNAVTVQAHQARHAPNGADPLPIGAAMGSSTVSSTSTNSRGAANAFALSDHQHLLDVSAVPISSLAGTLAIAHGGTGVTSLTANKILSTDASGNLVTAYDTGSSTIVYSDTAATLTNKTVASITNTVAANDLYANNTFNDPAVVDTVDTQKGPSPKTKYNVMASTAPLTGGTAPAGWGCLHDLAPIFYIEQDQSNARDLTTNAWTNRYIDRLIVDSTQVGDPATNPWSAQNYITLSNAGTINATLTFTSGIWECDISCVGYRCGYHRIALYNVTASAFITYAGTSTGAYSISENDIDSNNRHDAKSVRIHFRFAITSPGIQVQLRHWCSTATNTGGAGQGPIGVAGHLSATGSFTLLKKI